MLLWNQFFRFGPELQLGLGGRQFLANGARYHVIPSLGLQSEEFLVFGEFTDCPLKHGHRPSKFTGTDKILYLLYIFGLHLCPTVAGPEGFQPEDLSIEARVSRMEFLDHAPTFNRRVVIF